MKMIAVVVFSLSIQVSSADIIFSDNGGSVRIDVDSDISLLVDPSLVGSVGFRGIAFTELYTFDLPDGGITTFENPF